MIRPWLVCFFGLAVLGCAPKADAADAGDEGGTESTGGGAETTGGTGPDVGDGAETGDGGSDSTETGEDPPGNIDFSNLQVGQRSRYSLFAGEGYHDLEESSYSYADAVLIVEIVDQDLDAFVVEETFDGTPPPDLPDFGIGKSLSYLLRVEDDVLWVRGLDPSGYVNSWLFTQYSRKDDWHELPLVPFDGPAVEVVSWRTDLATCGCRQTGLVSAFELFGVEYSDLNVIVDDEGTQGDGPGFTHIYRRDTGIVRSTWMNPFFATGHGWDLLP